MNCLTLEELKAVGEAECNTVIEGDCLEAMNYSKDESIDLILADLPYG